jgi:hypothetical protein
MGTPCMLRNRVPKLMLLQVAKVIGVDIVEQSIADAERNAALNGITNTSWICGKAEDVMESMLDQGSLHVSPTLHRDPAPATAMPSNGPQGGLSMTDISAPSEGASGDETLPGGTGGDVAMAEGPTCGGGAEAGDVGTEDAVASGDLVGAGSLTPQDGVPVSPDAERVGGAEAGSSGQGISDARPRKLVAVVDPPRAGLHPKVSFHLIYVSFQVLLNLAFSESR